MRFLRYRSALLLLVLAQGGSYFVSSPEAASPDIVISQVYGGGGNSGATFTHDFIELYNRGPVPVSVDGWSVQYGSAAGVFGGTTTTRTPLSGTIHPGGYLLVREAQGAGGTTPLPTPHVTDDSPINMSGTDGKVALVTRDTALNCATATACAPQAAFIRDVVGWGNGVSYFEGTGAAPRLSNTTAALRLDGGRQDTDDNATDFESGSPNPRTSNGGAPTLSLADVSVNEGDTANPTATFIVQLSQPAGLGGVAFTIATEDGTATLADLDYINPGTVNAFIAPGDTSFMFSVTINADLKIEADEIFLVNVTNVTGNVTVADAQAVGTILNDDVETLAIHEIQGTVDRSPRVNEIVATTGIVTGRKGNGFFLQTPDADVDSLAETSEAVFVFTNQAPSTVAVGDAVRVTGRVVEFRRSGDFLPHTLTELSAPLSVTVLSNGNVLPTAVDVATIAVNATSRVAQLEPYESMLVRASSVHVVSPTNGFGEFYGVLAGRPRPFREPGIDVGDTLPANAPAGVTRFDGNFERLMVDSDESLSPAGLSRPPLVLATGGTVTPVFGPLDYAFDEYRVSLDSEVPLTVTPGMARRPLAAPAPSALSIVSLNVLNFFPASSSGPAQAAFAARVEEVANAIVNQLRTPDILGLIEVGDINGLRQLRDRVNALAGTSYEAYLIESDDDSERDQDVGYLVNQARVVIEREPYQIYRGEQFTVCADPTAVPPFPGISDTLFDRPPFVLEARFDGMPVTVILNHLRSLIDINSTAHFGPPACDETVGSRVREKRRLGAEHLADAIEARQDENLVVIGDMNAFELNDGYGDIIGTLEGTPADPSTVVEPSTDRWSYTMQSLVRLLPAAERYSYVHEGSAQVLDHILVNQAMHDRLTGFGYARINADFPESERLSDHDAAFGSFAPVAHLSTTTSLPAALMSGSAFSIDVNVSNAGPDRADTVVVSTTLTSGGVPGSVSAPDGWSCVVASSTVTCTADALAPGASAQFVIHATAACDLSNGSTVSTTTTASSTDDADSSDNGSNDTVTVSNPAPVISGVSVDTTVLWPPNHKMHDIRVAYATSDNCGTPDVLLGVRSNEPISGSGDGDAAPDWEVVGPDLVRLRAERAGKGTGRIYTITITATDSAGNSSSEAVTVAVPHNR